MRAAEAWTCLGELEPYPGDSLCGRPGWTRNGPGVRFLSACSGGQRQLADLHFGMWAWYPNTSALPRTYCMSSTRTLLAAPRPPTVSGLRPAASAPSRFASALAMAMYLSPLVVLEPLRGPLGSCCGRNVVFEGAEERHGVADLGASWAKW